MSAALEHFRAAPLQTLEIEGCQVRYRRFGSGPPLVFVHGWPMSGNTFRALVHELADDYCCYVLDLPGAGDSPWNPEIRDIFKDFGRLVASFVTQLDLREVFLVGHDSGGTIARLAAASVPQRVAGLMLTNTETPGDHLETVEAFQKIAGLPGAKAIFKLLLRSRMFLRSGFGFGGCFADKATIEGEFLETTIRPLQRDPSGALAQLRRGDLDIVDELEALHAKLDMPVLCVWGDSDPFFPLEHAQRMASNWAAPVTLEVVKDHRLLVHEDAPEVVARHMRVFLEQHARAFPRSATSA